MSTPAIHLDQLSFSYQALNRPPQPVLHNINLDLPQGSRCILVGANGAGKSACSTGERARRLRQWTAMGRGGKSTLLQILAGKRLTRGSTAQVLGQDVFFQTPEGVTYLGTEWANNPVVRSDLEVAHFLDSVGGYRYKERRDRLLDILDVDLSWHMHQVSDGERRRVQIVSGLMKPWEVLLLDEVTVDLDILVRTRLLDFLREETETRGATVLYASHLYDFDNWPTHLVHLQLGSTLPPSPMPWPLVEGQGKELVPASVLERMENPRRTGSRMLELASFWLSEDKKVRMQREIDEGGQARRGAPGAGETRDSETFYKKYDYSH